MSTYSVAKPSAAPEHTFLLADGRWTLKGHYLLEREGTLFPIQGRLMVVWNADEWFSLVGKLSFSVPTTESDVSLPADITLQYRGRIDASDQYTFMLQHSRLGQIEGEGLLLPDSILQRFWILGDREGRTGLERLYRIDNDHYYWSSSLLVGNTLLSTMEAKLERYK
ncbi:MAG: hypothetical protein WCD18_18365 [Thermosynechococcaceae cyanobacterium]